MNTVQLILLWYGGLAIVTVLVFTAMDRGVWPSILALALVTALAVYTFSSGVKARRRWVALFVLGPIVLGGGLLYGWNEYTERRAVSLIRSDEVELNEVGFVPQGLGANPRLSGKIRNRSAYWLQAVTVEFVVSESGDVIDRRSTTFYPRVPPGEVRFLKEEWTPLQDSTFKRLLNEKNSGLKLNIRVTGTRGAKKEY
jgi:hypothetical protein